MTSNRELWIRAQSLFAGGVNSPVRAFRAVGGDPVYFASGRGSRLTSVEGRSYVDYVGAWGPQILGHARPEVVEAVREAAAETTSIGACGPREIALAEEIRSALPSMELIRFVNSGTEATMSALRLARGFTGRNKVVKFSGCYHGHADGLLVKAGSGAMTFGVPDSAGVPGSYAGETLVARYNDISDVEMLFDRHGGDVAAVILEPVVGNMGVVLPEPGFLEALRALCDETGALLVFDEVMTGFRVARGGAQARFGIRPDLTCLGKIIGGGLPVGAYGGRAEIMEMLAPLGPVYQAGTNSGNPVVMAAGLATLRLLTESVYDRLEELSNRLAQGLERCAEGRAIVQRVGSMLTLFFVRTPGVRVRNADDLSHVEKEPYARLFHHYLDGGIYAPPSAFEAFFVSHAHTDEEIDLTVDAFDRFCKSL